MLRQCRSLIVAALTLAANNGRFEAIGHIAAPSTIWLARVSAYLSMYWGAKTGQAYASFLHMCVVCSRRTCSSLGPPPPLMTRTQETESGLCHRPRERARLHQRLIIWLSNQSSRLASLARPKLWYVGAPVKTKKNVISDAAMMMTGAPTCTHTHTHRARRRLLIMTSPMCHTIPGQHRQFAGGGVPHTALVRLILVVEVVLPAPERCDLESRSSLVKPAYSPSKTSPVLPGGRATTRAGCLPLQSSRAIVRSRSARWPTPRFRFVTSPASEAQSSPAWCPAPSHAPLHLDRLMCLNVRAPIDDV
ncbi:hypothetical protein GGP41_003185 [Bipolaris sorokiniana]|uniref:Uncharacterized protein n=1 Tax=Cochliobolus sativus TaxID=45130 RepID=A0A8H6DT10_COCSA|nr:hypothetical protein GGP41_003185 [Bipolaris sorokiniana]